MEDNELKLNIKQTNSKLGEFNHETFATPRFTNRRSRNTVNHNSYIKRRQLDKRYLNINNVALYDFIKNRIPKI